MLDRFLDTLAKLADTLSRQRLANDAEYLWVSLAGLLRANAPSGGAGLPGAIADDIAGIVRALNLTDRFIPHIGSTGNMGIWLGAEKPEADVVIVSHMDRPSFRVRSAESGDLFAICADRFPDGAYTVGGKALRFEGGRLVVGARGKLISVHTPGRESLRFVAEHGRLMWHDTITMDVDPVRNGDTVSGTGLDNCFGLIAVLGAAAALRSIEALLRAKGRRALFVFTDLEEGLPEAFFGHGAARLRFAIPQPTFGAIVADAQTIVPGGTLVMGQGAGYGTVSAWSRGSIVPPNYIALAVDLAAALNAKRPGTAQMNTGYLSRSDDMILGRWTQILGMIGAPMADAHTGYESGRLSDIQSAIWWLAYYTASALALDDEVAQQYGITVRV